ncbi:MAG: hypothetical protein Q8M16_21915, partial [Pirellulaceae bacterium]|nr:hypothetical protein [Pirellulaceae bacterium]
MLLSIANSLYNSTLGNIFRSATIGSSRRTHVAGIAIAAMVCSSTSIVSAQSTGLVGAPSRLDSPVRTVEYNAEWVESSSPIAGGMVSTTHFPSNGNTITTVRENVGLGGTVLTSAPLPQGYAPPAMTGPNYA